MYFPLSLSGGAREDSAQFFGRLERRRVASEYFLHFFSQRTLGSRIDKVQIELVGVKVVEGMRFLQLDRFLQVTNRLMRRNIDWKRTIIADNDAVYCIIGWLLRCHCCGRNQVMPHLPHKGCGTNGQRLEEYHEMGTDLLRMYIYLLTHLRHVPASHFPIDSPQSWCV